MSNVLCRYRTAILNCSLRCPAFCGICDLGHAQAVGNTEEQVREIISSSSKHFRNRLEGLVLAPNLPTTAAMN